jgi:hypothetical protein
MWRGRPTRVPGSQSEPEYEGGGKPGTGSCEKIDSAHFLRIFSWLEMYAQVQKIAYRASNRKVFLGMSF